VRSPGRRGREPSRSRSSRGATAAPQAANGTRWRWACRQRVGGDWWTAWGLKATASTWCRRQGAAAGRGGGRCRWPRSPLLLPTYSCPLGLGRFV
jgi:hypothetical protein